MPSSDFGFPQSWRELVFYVARAIASTIFSGEMSPVEARTNWLPTVWMHVPAAYSGSPLDVNSLWLQRLANDVTDAIESVNSNRLIGAGRPVTTATGFGGYRISRTNNPYYRSRRMYRRF